MNIDSSLVPAITGMYDKNFVLKNPFFSVFKPKKLCLLFPRKWVKGDWC